MVSTTARRQYCHIRPFRWLLCYVLISTRTTFLYYRVDDDTTLYKYSSLAIIIICVHVAYIHDAVIIVEPTSDLDEFNLIFF